VSHVPPLITSFRCYKARGEEPAGVVPPLPFGDASFMAPFNFLSPLQIEGSSCFCRSKCKDKQRPARRASEKARLLLDSREGRGRFTLAVNSSVYHSEWRRGGTSKFPAVKLILSSFLQTMRNEQTCSQRFFTGQPSLDCLLSQHPLRRGAPQSHQGCALIKDIRVPPNKPCPRSGGHVGGS